MDIFKKSFKKMFCIVSLFLFSVNVFALNMDDVRKKMNVQKSKIKDIVVTGKIENMEGKGKGMFSYIKIYKKGIMSRNELTIDIPSGPDGKVSKMTQITIFDGKKYWDNTPIIGTKRIAQNAVKNAVQPRHFFMDFSQGLGDNAKLIGSDSVKGRDCYKILIQVSRSKPNDKVYMWVDMKSGMLAKIEDMGTKTSLITSDYRKVDGMEMPFINEFYEDGKLVNITTFDSIKVNKGISDDLFNPEKAKIKGAKGFTIPGVVQMKKGLKSNKDKGEMDKEEMDEEEIRDSYYQDVGVQE